MSGFIAVSLNVTAGDMLRSTLRTLMTAVEAGSVGMALLLAVLYLVCGFFVLYVIVQMVLRLALIDILLALAPIALGLWILPHTAGWGRHWLRLFMTTVFQQAVQLIALALGFGFLKEFAAIAAFEPVQDLVWKLLMSLAFVYMATRVPSMLGNHGTFDSWLSMLYFGMNLPSSLMRSARTIGLVAGGAAGRSGRHGDGSDGGQRGRFGRRQRPQLGGLDGHPIGWRGRRRRRAQEQRGVAPPHDNNATARTRPAPANDTTEDQQCADNGESPRRQDEAMNAGCGRPARRQKGAIAMEQLTQTISNLVGILLGVVGAIGVGFFIYGAYLDLTASGAPHQMERGKSAMMTALAGIVLALVAYGVVDPGIEVDDVLPEPQAPGGGDSSSSSSG